MCYILQILKVFSVIFIIIFLGGAHDTTCVCRSEDTLVSAGDQTWVVSLGGMLFRYLVFLAALF